MKSKPKGTTGKPVTDSASHLAVMAAVSPCSPNERMLIAAIIPVLRKIIRHGSKEDLAAAVAKLLYPDEADASASDADAEAHDAANASASEVDAEAHDDAHETDGKGKR